MSSALTIEVEADRDFVETPYVKELTERSLHYINAGFPIHFRGPAGTGKSTLAKHIAGKLGRPISLIHGDEALTSASLIGGEVGYRYKRVRDNFISTVLKEEEVVTKGWVDNRLTEACRQGYTLIYDEFTRSRPEANNVLLPVLQDRILTLYNESYAGNPYIEVDPYFTAIFTSNPEEYAGTHKTQDALKDRMITIDLAYPDHDTELKIVYAKARLPLDVCELITKIVRQVRASDECDRCPTIRAGIMIAKVLTGADLEPQDDPALFTSFCQDILLSEAGKTGASAHALQMTIGKVVADHINENNRSHYIALSS